VTDTETLAERLAAVERALTDCDCVAGRARYAARAAYVDRVLARLDRIRRGLTAARGDRDRTVDDPLVASVDVAPAYLSTAAVSRETVGVRGTGTYHPLGTRNVNLVTVPHGDAADTLVGELFGTERVRLSTAARTLRAARRTAGETGDGTSAGRQDGSAGRARALSLGRRATTRTDALPAGPRAVDRTLSRWDGTAARALAVSNRSVTPVLVARVAREHPRFDRLKARARLGWALNATLSRALSEGSVRPPRGPTGETAEAVRALARRESARAIEAGARRLQRRLRGPLSELPAGFPVAPVPGYCYATVKVWTVSVEGRYERVVLRSRTGRPGEDVVYVRDGRPVRHDDDGDESPEHLGRAERVDVDVTTAVAVAVPPGPRGVGDTGGDADERSANETTYGVGS
jgi:hypothetical protein